MKQLEQAERPNPELILQVGTLFLRYESYEQATKAFEKLVALHSLKPEVYLMLAEAYDKQGKPDDAYRALSKSIEVEPKSEDGYLALATFSSAHHNNQFGLKTIGKGLEKIPGSSRLLLQQGVLWALGRLEGRKQLSKASQANPRCGLPVCLGVSQLQAGKPPGRKFQKVAKQDSNNYQ
jgi:tetratricopeptide (TPR) repeat protein